MRLNAGSRAANGRLTANGLDVTSVPVRRRYGDHNRRFIARLS